MEHSMQKLRLALAAVAVFIPAVVMAAPSDSSFGSNIDTNQLDNFFAAGNLGKTEYRTDISHPNSVFQNLRFGWRWNGLIGAEIGYAYLGRRKDVGPWPFYTESSVNARALTLGLNGKYNFYNGFFVTAHGGYLRSQRKDTDTWNTEFYNSANYPTKYTSWNNGWYGGLGVGYDVTQNVSLALNYDNYHLQYTRNTFHERVNVAAYSASIEYRF
jgi:OmpA-OmpF porin, OOP family